MKMQPLIFGSLTALVASLQADIGSCRADAAAVAAAAMKPVNVLQGAGFIVVCVQIFLDGFCAAVGSLDAERARACARRAAAQCHHWSGKIPCVS